MEKHIKNASPIQTTFVQADAASFKELVQKLTGASGGASAGDLNYKATVAVTSSPRNCLNSPRNQQHSHIDQVTRVRHLSFKAQERRPKRQLEVKLGLGSARPFRGSPSSRSSTPAAGSPVTPLRYETSSLSSGEATMTESPPSSGEKGSTENWLLCFLRPSVPTQSNPPTLLTLFPLTSPAHQP